MDSQERSFTCSVAFCDDEPFEWRGKAESAKRAAELAVADVAWDGDDEAGVKVVDDQTGEVTFFDVSVTVSIKTEANPVDMDEQERRLAQLADES